MTLGLATGLAFLLVAARLASEAQPAAKVYRITVLTNYDSLNDLPGFDGFREGLRELRYVEGQNIVVDIRGSTNYQRLPHLPAELLRSKPDVIAHYGGAPRSGPHRG